jgi:hypothetical protein
MKIGGESILQYSRPARMAAVFAAVVVMFFLPGCATREQNIALGVLGATVLGAQAPSSEIEVIYYLGVFDPQDQVPATVYRVRVHGQASFISQAKFASGWVRAELIDSLSTGGRFENGGLTVDQSNTLGARTLQTGRRLMMFGPEGFREAPKDHRLVVVMGSNPAAFFQAMDESVGVINDAQAARQNSDLVKKLFQALAQIKNESDRLGDLGKNVTSTFPSSK